MSKESQSPHRYQIVGANDGREQWVPLEEAKSLIADPAVGAEIGGFVLGNFGPAWEITPSELQEIRGEIDQDSGSPEPS